MSSLAVHMAPARRQDSVLELDLYALPPEVRAQFEGHLAGLAKLCREEQLNAKQVGQAVTMAVTKRLSSRLCEDCDSKYPSYGLEDARKPRWCSGCAKSHEGAVREPGKQCEDCDQKQPTFGLVEERIKRWCSGCAKLHEGSASLMKQCEDCGLKAPNFGFTSAPPAIKVSATLLSVA